MRRLSPLLLSVGLVISACSAAPPAPVEQVLSEGALSRTGGCGDVFIFATNEGNSLALTVNWPGVASRAHAAGGLLSQTAELPQAEISVALQVGQFLSDGFCTDVLMPDRPRVLGEVPASSGTLEIAVQPAVDAEAFMPISQATLELTDVVFQVPIEDGFEIWRIPSLELRDIEVGWMAG